MQRRDLEGLTRDELIVEAERLGVPRPRVLTQPDLIDEILARSARSERERSRARGFLGRARDLLARVVERGLHLPEAARALRGSPPPEPWPPPPPPLPTVTLAEIYAAQGHIERAVAVLDEVLAREPDHEGARQLRGRLLDQAKRPRGKRAGEAPPPSEAQAGGASAPAGSPKETGTGVEEGAIAGAKAAPPEAPAVEPAPGGVAGVRSAAAVKEVPSTTSVEQVPVAAATVEEVPARVEEVRAAAPGAAAIEAAPAAVITDAAPAARAAEVAPASEVPQVEDEGAPLPDRYDVDEIVGMAVDPETVYLYWEVRPTTLARARVRRPGGQLVIQLVAVLPSWDGPLVERRNVAVDALFGDRFVRGIPAGANVRLSIGWAEGEDFEPLAVGAEIAAPRAFPLPGSAPGAAPRAVRAVRGALPHGVAHEAGAAGAAGGRAAGAAGSRAASGPAAVGRAAGGRSAGAARSERGAPFAAEQAEDVAWTEGPGRFPSGTTPTAEEVAHAVALTRGGASELGREGEAGPEEAGPGGPSLGGASELWRGLGGASEPSWRIGGAR